MATMSYEFSLELSQKILVKFWVYDFRTLGKIQKYLLKKNIFESV